MPSPEVSPTVERLVFGHLQQPLGVSKLQGQLPCLLLGRLPRGEATGACRHASESIPLRCAPARAIAARVRAARKALAAWSRLRPMGRALLVAGCLAPCLACGGTPPQFPYSRVVHTEDVRTDSSCVGDGCCKRVPPGFVGYCRDAEGVRWRAGCSAGPCDLTSSGYSGWLVCKGDGWHWTWGCELAE
jgi:hypothetical protein